MDLSAIGARIKEARLKKKLTQEQLTALADVGFYYIGEIERGQKLPSFLINNSKRSMTILLTKNNSNLIYSKK